MAGVFKQAGYSLSNPYPNPVSIGQTTTVIFTIPDKLPVAYKIYDGMGNIIINDIKFYDAGTHNIDIDASIFAPYGPGDYIFTFYAGDFYDFTRIKFR